MLASGNDYRFSTYHLCRQERGSGILRSKTPASTTPGLVHKVSRWLVDTYDAIVLQDLSFGFMLQGNLARATHDVELGGIPPDTEVFGLW